MTRLDWPACENIRDLGGLPTTDGDVIRARALVRADSPHRLTLEGIEALRAYGVVRIVDLRNTFELETEPSPFAGDAIYRHSPMIDAEADRGYDRRSDTSLAAVYRGSVTRNASHIVVAIAAVADAPPGCVLLHCSAGKDRTGMVVALALAVAGVADEIIAEDYAYTQVCLRRRLDAALAAAADDEEREHIREWKSAAAPTMRTMLDHLTTRWGGAAAYLSANGLHDDQVKRLRDRLTGHASASEDHAGQRGDGSGGQVDRERIWES